MRWWASVLRLWASTIVDERLPIVVERLTIADERPTIFIERSPDSDYPLDCVEIRLRYLFKRVIRTFWEPSVAVLYLSYPARLKSRQKPCMGVFNKVYRDSESQSQLARSCRMKKIFKNEKLFKIRRPPLPSRSPPVPVPPGPAPLPRKNPT